MMDDGYQPTLPHGNQSDRNEPKDDRKGLADVGQQLLNRYEIFRIKQGGFGIVYFVTDHKTGQEYAVKTYKPEFAHLTPSTEQFLSEVNFWINLEPHPNIVKAHFVEVIGKQPYLFLDYVDGGANTSLRDWIWHGQISRDQAIDFAYQLCLAMEFANQKTEIVHGDLKPENILIDKEGTLKVTDFGLAHRVQIASGHYPRLSMGSWPYASPERFKGEVEDARSDMYSFGVIFHEMLTAKLPYPFPLLDYAEGLEKQFYNFHTRGGGRELCEKFYYGSIPDPSDGILLKCLDNQADRFINFSGLRRSLEKRFHIDPSKYVGRSKPKGTDLHQRALALHKIGHFSEAMVLYNTVLQQRPNEAVLWFDAAQTLLATGQNEIAQSFLNKARDLDPNIGNQM
ncbi:MAG TPA: protein kinase [Anaerolineales bacterium]|nr:protein kinase [Anaerolineales bacterium]